MLEDAPPYDYVDPENADLPPFRWERPSWASMMGQGELAHTMVQKVKFMQEGPVYAMKEVMIPTKATERETREVLEELRKEFVKM